MSDQLRRTLERLDGPVAPDRAFADELFSRLLQEAGAPRDRLRPRRRRIRGVPDGVRRALVAAIALGLAAGVFVLTLPLLRSTDEPQLGDYGDVPPFRGIVEFTIAAERLPTSTPAPIPVEGVDNPQLTPGPHRIEVVYAGPDAWRFESLDDGLGSILPAFAGSIGAWDGERFRIYDASVHAFYRQSIASADAFTILNALAWSATGEGWEEHCDDAEVIGSDVLLEREAIAVRCASAGSRLWLDAQTGLVLRAEVAAEAQPRPFQGPIGPGPGGGFRFVEISYGEVTTQDAAFDPPPDAVPVAELPPPPPTPPTTLTVGEPVPSLPALEADGLELRPSNGRPTALYAWATWCHICVGEPLEVFDHESELLSSELNAFAISFLDEPDAASALFEDEELAVGLFHDADGELALWGVEGIPTLIVLDGDGRLLGAYAGDLDGEEVRAVLQTAAVGDPLPELGGQTVQQIA